MENNELLHELNACAIVCNMCYNGCLNEKEVSIMARCIELNRECADICQLSASMFARDSENIDAFLKLCAKICETCAEECEKHDKEYCRKCARVCRKCQEMCFSYQPEHSAHHVNINH
jgi:hypothetical protein